MTSYIIAACILSIVAYVLIVWGSHLFYRTEGGSGPGLVIIGTIILVVAHLASAISGAIFESNKKFEQATGLNYAHKCITTNEDVIYEWGPGITDNTSMPKCKEVKND